MKKINVALILYKTDLTGGPGNILLNLVSQFNLDKFKFIFLAKERGPLTEQLQNRGFEVKFICMPIIEKTKPWFFLWSVWQAWSFFKLNRVEIAHFYFDRYRDSVLVGARLAGVKSVMHIHGPAQDFYKSWVGKADYFIFNSDFVQKLADYSDLPSSKQKVIHYGISANDFLKKEVSQNSSELENQPKKTSGEKFIGVVSRIHPAKKIELALKAFSIIKENISTKLVIIGNIQDKSYYQELKKLLEELNLKEHVSFLGHVENTVAIYKKLDLLLHTAYQEGFGFVFLEAAITKVPVVAFASGGMCEVIIDGRTGRLIPYGEQAANINELAQAAKEVLENKSRAKEFAENAYTRAINNFSTAKHQDEVEKVYLSLLE